jgi:chromosome segregation ATPase
MNIDWSAGAIWAAIGAIVVKLIDFFMGARKDKTDQVVATYDAVNEAQKQLVEGLFQQVRLLQEDLAALRVDLEKCEEQHRTANAKVADLAAEVAMLKAKIAT